MLWLFVCCLELDSGRVNKHILLKKISFHFCNRLCDGLCENKSVIIMIEIVLHPKNVV
jgi:hypothetical protein